METGRLCRCRVLQSTWIDPRVLYRSELEIGNWECVVQERLNPSEYLSGRVFLGSAVSAAASAAAAAIAAAAEDGEKLTVKKRKKMMMDASKPLKMNALAAPAPKILPTVSAAASQPFKKLKTTGLGEANKSSGGGGGGDGAASDKPYLEHKFRYDPTSPDAIVLNKSVSLKPFATKLIEFPVCIDPHIGRALRPHQVEGIRFLYECVMGARHSAYRGAILADSMGLGKSLQIISLLWTLLKDGPKGSPVVHKACIVCPMVLITHWADEFRKWLGTHRLQTISVDASLGADGQQASIERFCRSNVAPVLIIGYEMVRDAFCEVSPLIRMMLCRSANTSICYDRHWAITAL